MNGQRLPSSDSFATCSAAARTCSPSAGRTNAEADLATHRAARTSGNAVSVVSRRCAAANAPIKRSSRSTIVSCSPTFKGATSSGSIRCSPTTVAGSSRSISTAGSWRDDVQALARTCHSLGIHPAIERSRSGNGAHIWFFFTDPVPAAEARRLGFTILTATMAHGVALGVDSYDRLFPSQDVLPSGGFGNLIALPLQREARNAGNTEFLDDELEPHRDQWSYLASIPKITPDRLAELIANGDEDQILAVRPATDPSDRPWRPPRTLRERLSETRLPESIDATFADRVYIDRSRLPPTLAHALRRLATFSNPMFTELQRMRLSVARTPRVIGCFEDLDRYLALPRGCLADVAALIGGTRRPARRYATSVSTASRSSSNSAASSTTRSAPPPAHSFGMTSASCAHPLAGARPCSRHT